MARRDEMEPTDKLRSTDSLFFVGINIGENEGRSRAAAGEIERIRYKERSGEIRVMRGVYLRSGLSKGTRRKLLCDNAVRLALSTHRKGSAMFLAGPTALNLAPVNGVVHLASINHYSDKVVESGFVISYQEIDDKLGWEMPAMRALVRTDWLEDEFGRFRVNTLPDELVFLYSFVDGRLRKDTGEPISIERRQLSLADQRRLVERMKAEKGSVEAVKGALGRMAAFIGRKGGPALHEAAAFIDAHYRYHAPVTPDIELTVRTGELRTGEISETHKLWRYEHKSALPLTAFVRNPTLVKPGDVPVFFECLLPERFRPVDGKERANFFRLFLDGGRYLNGISIHSAHALPVLIEDRIVAGASLARHTDADAVFQGAVELMPRADTERRAQKDLLTRLCETPYEPGHPFVPGMQEKAACHLDDEGVLRFAKNRPFTHILKFPGPGSYATKGVVEWACMQLLQAAGVQTNACALVEIPGAGWGYLAERFDIPNEDAGTGERLLSFEDFCSVMNRGIHLKYHSIDLAEIARVIYTESSAAREDLEAFFRRVTGSVLLGDFDGHARNFGLLSSLPAARAQLKGGVFIDPPGSFEGLRVRLSPAFDVFSTVVYSMSNEVPLPMASHRAYDREAFMAFARHCALSTERAQQIVSDMAARMRERVRALIEASPAAIATDPLMAHAIEVIRCRIDRGEREITDAPPPAQPAPLPRRASP